MTQIPPYLQSAIDKTRAAASNKPVLTAEQQSAIDTVMAMKQAKLAEQQNNPQSLESAWRTQWDADAALRAEFGNSIDSWLAYSRAKHKGLTR